MSSTGNTLSGSTSLVNTVNNLTSFNAPMINNNVVSMNCFPVQTSPIHVALSPPLQINSNTCPVITTDSWMSDLNKWANYSAFQPVLVNNNGFVYTQMVKVLPPQTNVMPPSPLFVPLSTLEINSASNSVFSCAHSASSSGDSATSRESSISLDFSRSNSVASSVDNFYTPSKRIVEFILFAKGSFKVIKQRGFQLVLEKLMKKHVHPSITVNQVHDPTKPNVFKRNMINGVIISCSVVTDANEKSFKPDLTSVNSELETKHALYSDISVYNEDPLDINRAASAEGERVSYKNYNTDLLCNTEKINVSKRSTEDLNDFLDTVRDLLYRYSESISFCKAVYTKKKNVFKTFYITLCFGEDANEQCAEIHKEFEKLGISTYRSKSDKKQSRNILRNN